MITQQMWHFRQEVLIESDWNLKGLANTEIAGSGCGINRIRLEFKVYSIR